jgi:hypothetical protein
MDNKGKTSGNRVIDHLANLFSASPSIPAKVVKRFSHPLDQLSIEEVAILASAIRSHSEKLGIASLRFNFISAKVRLAKFWPS